MTRHNLDEHLPWLLSAKPSLPPDTSSLPPVSASFPSGSTSSFDGGDFEPLPSTSIRSQRQQGLAEPGASRGGGGIGSGGGGSRESGEGEEMARTVNAPRAMSRPQASHASPRPPTASPSKTARPLPRPPPRPPTSPSKPTAAQRTPMREQPPAMRNVQDNAVEFLDLTEDNSFPDSPTPKKQIASNTGRKRKSEEFDRDARNPISSAKRPALPVTVTFRPSQEFQSIDEMDSPDKLPSEPPPPYSTMAPPKVKPVARSPQRNVISPSVESTTSRKPFKASGVPDSEDEEEEDGEELMNFSGLPRKPTQDSQSRDTPSKSKPAPTQGRPATTVFQKSPSQPKHKTPAAPCVVHYPDLTPAIAANAEVDDRVKHSFAISPAPKATPVAQQPRIDEPPPTTGGRRLSPTTEEDLSLLKRFFEAPRTAVERVEKDLESQKQSIYDAETDLFDRGMDDDPELTRQKNNLHDRTDALTSLLEKSTTFQEAMDVIAQVRAEFRKTTQARQPTDHLKAARDAAHADLRTLEDECLVLLGVCKKDIRAVIEIAEKSSAKRQRVDVESTQVPQNPVQDRRAAIPSSSRIAQTQFPQPVAPAAENRTKPCPAPEPLRRSPAKQQQQQVADDSPMFDDNDTFDELEDSEMGGTDNNVFTNRMGTPPRQYEIEDDDDDYGMDDDDEEMLLETEFRSTRPSKPSQSQTRPQSARKKNMSAEEDAELKRKNFSYPWSKEVMRVMSEKFELKGFRENQCEAINATLAGKDTFVLMPTGGGKSLCYQLPALVTSGKTRGVTIVISPLVSLMEDQVQHLRQRNIQAFLINSETSRDERFALMDAMKRPNVEKFIQLLYITPEMLSKSQAMIDNFERLYHRQRMARLVIDEAHCVSQWGHDFRPDYTAIGEIRRKFPGVPVMALTATATEAVKFDTIHNLGIDGCEVLTRSFNRPNLYYEVRMKGKGKEDVESIASLIKEKHTRQTGIIYCLSRKNCEDMAKALEEKHGIQAHHYHAGMETAAKSEVQRAWQDGQYHVIVATIAFGMGIDKADVRYVIHHSIPKSLEGYYQETGRAGRDGRASSCYLFYGYGDAGKLRRMIDDSDGSREQKDRQKQMLRKMTQYCDNRSDCRRVQVLRYFSERFDRAECNGGCDNCKSDSTFEDVDYSGYARDAVGLVENIGPLKATILQCIDAFRGAPSKKIKELKKEKLKLEEFIGTGSDIDRGDAERLFYKLLSEDAIREENILNKKSGFATPYVKLGPKASGFLNGRASLMMQIRNSPRKPAKAPVKKTKKTAAAPREMPMSTNISSPIQQATASKRKRGGHQTTLRDLHANGYSRDDFVVSDPDDEDFQGSDGESEAFDPPRAAPKARKAKAAKEQGPSMLPASALKELDQNHQFLVDDFVVHAEKKVKDIMNKRNLKMAPFTNTMLVEMAINFTDTEEKMMSVRGIDPERVRLFGKHFTKMAAEMRARYDEISGVPADADEEPPDQHAQNVIDLVSDDDDNQYGSMPEESEDEGPGEQSRFFAETAPDRDVEEFNKKFAFSQSAGMRTMPASQPARRKSPKNNRQRNWKPKAHQARGGGGGGKGGPSRRTSGDRSASGAGVQKRTANKGKNSRGAAGPSKSGATSKKAGGGGGIGMMPT